MQDQIQADLKAAMIARDELKKTTLQGIKATLKYAEIEGGSELDDAAVVKVLQKEAKKRKESAALFEQGGNQESADKEKAELEIIEAYLPEMASEEAVTAAVEKAMADTGASSMQDMGKVIGAVKGALGETADGAVVAKIVKEKLQ
jgi:uncharacterized protein YqeY